MNKRNNNPLNKRFPGTPSKTTNSDIYTFNTSCTSMFSPLGTQY